MRKPRIGEIGFKPRGARRRYHHAAWFRNGKNGGDNFARRALHTGGDAIASVGVVGAAIVALMTGARFRRGGAR